MAPPERRLRVEVPAAGSGAFEEWRRDDAGPAPELWERHREVWERLRVMPVGMEDGVFYGFAETPAPGLEEEVFRELAPELPALRRVRLRRPRGFVWPGTQDLRATAGLDLSSGLAWDWTGRTFRPRPSETSALEARGFRYGGWLYAVPEVEVEGDVPPGAPVRVRVRRGALELAVLRRLAGEGPVVAYLRDPWLRAAAEAVGFRVTDSPAEARAAVRPALWEGRGGTVTLVPLGAPKGPPVRLKIRLLTAGPGVGVRVRIGRVPDRQRT